MSFPLNTFQSAPGPQPSGNTQTNRKAYKPAVAPEKIKPGEVESLPQPGDLEKLHPRINDPTFELPDKNFVPKRSVPDGIEDAPIGPRIIPQGVSVPARLELTVGAPERKQVGSGASFLLTVKNSGDETAENVVVDCDFDDNLVFPGSDEKQIKQTLGRLVPGETKEVGLTLVSDQLGKHSCRFTVTSDDLEKVWKSVAVEFLPKQLELSIIGPTHRTVGSKAEFLIKLANISEQPLSEIQVIVSNDASLTPHEASEGIVKQNGSLVWKIESLGAKQGMQLQLEYACNLVAEQACMQVKVLGSNFPDERAERCLQVTPISGILDLQIRDTQDPVKLGEEIEYVVEVRNRGLQDARKIQLSAKIPEGAQVLSAQTFADKQQLDFDVENSRLTFSTVEFLAPDAVLSYSIQLKAMQTGDLQFSVGLSHVLSTSPTVVREWSTVNE